MAELEIVVELGNLVPRKNLVLSDVYQMFLLNLSYVYLMVISYLYHSYMMFMRYLKC